MKIKSRFILFFSLFTIIISGIIGLTGVIFIKSEIRLFINAPNKEFVSIMADKLLLKSLISFIGLIVIITVLSIYIGLYLFKLISNSFLSSVQKITGLAKDRIKLGLNKTEDELLKEYISVLINDQKILKEYEKINAWKDGARLLIHELKNPLTPLKLSLESMILTDSNQYDDIKCAIASTKDIENILSNFKNLVDIDYAPLETFDFTYFYNNCINQVLATYPDLVIHNKLLNSRIMINSEMNLLKMLLLNLINNGMEENPLGFYIEMNMSAAGIVIEFITPDRTIEDIERCFVMGFSNKGNERGYGLFLCKQISEYLDINIRAENIDNNVVFCLEIKKESVHE